VSLVARYNHGIGHCADDELKRGWVEI